MTRADFERLHALLDGFETAAGTLLTTPDEYEHTMSDIRADIIRHVEQIEGQAKRNARRTA